MMMKIFRLFSSSFCRQFCLLVLLCTATSLGCSTEIDPTNPYDPDNVDRIPFGISVDLIFPQNGPEVETGTITCINVEDSTQFKVIPVVTDQIQEVNGVKRLQLDVDNVAIGNYVLFVDIKGYTINPTAAIFAISDPSETEFTFELALDI